MSPTQRELKHWRELGFDVEVVERWVARGRVRRDLFGAFDLLAFDDRVVVGIQVTTGSHHADRRRKLQDNPRVARWVKELSRRAYVVSWTKRETAGGAVRWYRREEGI